MGDIIPFTGGKLPSYLKTVDVDVSDFTSGVGAGGFPVLSIKGKVFTLVKDGERTIVADPDDPDEPSTSLEVVLIAANKHLSKVYYASSFEEGSNAAPDCYSNNGETPEPDAASKQATTCAACPHNVFGSGNQGRGKACSDARRVAIAPAGELSEVMLLRVPPASLKPLAEYARKVGERALPLRAVVTQLRFEAAESSPKLKFKPVGLLPEDDYLKACEVADQDITKMILGEIVVPSADTSPTKKKKVTTEEVKKAVEEDDGFDALDNPAPKAKPKATPKPKAKPKAAPEPEPEDDDGDDLDDLLAEFDA